MRLTSHDSRSRANLQMRISLTRAADCRLHLYAPCISRVSSHIKRRRPMQSPPRAGHLARRRPTRSSCRGVSSVLSRTRSAIANIQVYRY